MSKQISRRTALIGTASVLAIAAIPSLSALAAGEEASVWKMLFSVEFAGGVDWQSGPRKEILDWIWAEAEGAFNGIENPLSSNPAEEAREALYAIGAMS